MTSKLNPKSLTQFNLLFSLYSLIGNLILTIFCISILIKLILSINTTCSNDPGALCGSSQFFGYLFSIFIILPLLDFLILSIYSLYLLCSHLNARKIRRATSSVILLSSPFVLIPFAICIQFIASIITQDNNSFIITLLNSTDNANFIIAGIITIGLYFLSLTILSIIYKSKLAKQQSPTA